ncbi:MAG: BtpA/SgcQ family protein [Planctomycetota bacterium]
MSPTVRTLSFLPQGAPHLIGVIHLPPLPGSPRAQAAVDEIFERAQADAKALMDGGIRAAILENFGDAPFFPDQTPPHVPALMAAVARALTGSGLALGINVLRNDARSALAAALAGGASFIRVNVHVGAAVTDQGLIEGRAFETLRYRREIGAESIAILADVDVKHAAPLVTRPLEGLARETAGRGGADALILSGEGTGRPTDLAQVERVKAAVPDHPVLVGSGVTIESAAKTLQSADGAIVGTCLKHDGDVEAPVDPKRVQRLVEAARH